MKIIIEKTKSGVSMSNDGFSPIEVLGIFRYLEKKIWLKMVNDEGRKEKLKKNSEVFEHYGKPLTSGRDLWNFLTTHYNFTPKT